MKENENKEVKQPENLDASKAEVLTEIEEKAEELSKYIIIPDVTITRKVVSKSGKVYKDYFVNGKLRGVDVQVRVRPGKDDGGFVDVNNYAMLDIVFGTKLSVMLAVQTYKRRDTLTKRSITGFTYHAYDKDQANGEEWAAPLRFETISDKAMITKLIEIANRDHNLGLSL